MSLNQNYSVRPGETSPAGKAAWALLGAASVVIMICLGAWLDQPDDWQRNANVADAIAAEQRVLSRKEAMAERNRQRVELQHCAAVLAKANATERMP